MFGHQCHFKNLVPSTEGFSYCVFALFIGYNITTHCLHVAAHMFHIPQSCCEVMHKTRTERLAKSQTENLLKQAVKPGVITGEVVRM